MAFEQIDYAPASLADAPHLATMSRDLVELGLGWSWTPSRIAWHVRALESVVLVARENPRIAGFAVMRFGYEDAHLDLLAVRPAYRRAGIGRGLMAWLEKSALVAGISVIRLEVRATNEGARSFYDKLGYRPMQRIRGYYDGRETAVRMAKDLWCDLPLDATPPPPQT